MLAEQVLQHNRLQTGFMCYGSAEPSWSCFCCHPYTVLALCNKEQQRLGKAALDGICAGEYVLAAVRTDAEGYMVVADGAQLSA